MSENESRLPEGWVYATLGDTGEYFNGMAFKPKDWEEVGRPIIRIQNLNNPEKPINRTTQDVKEKYLVRHGDLLVSWSATLDAFKWQGEEAVLNQHIFNVRPNEALDKQFIFHTLKYQIRALINSEHMHGSTMRHVNRKPFMSHIIPLPPLAEQERIVDKIDELFSAIEAGERAIEQARIGVARYRKAILKAAVTGELTKDWRDESPAKECAEDLLTRILTARYEAWEKTELAKLDAKGKAHPKTEKEWEKFRARYKPPVEPDLSKFPTLPSNWVWVSSDAVTQVTKLAGFEFTKFVNYVDDGDLPVVKAGNVAQNDYKSSRMAKVKSSDVSDLVRSELFGGEILMAFVGANLGKVSILPSDEKYFLGPNVAVIRPRLEFLSSQFGTMFYQSDFGFTRLRNSSVGAAQGSISMGRIRNAAIPMMGKDEQAEIVDRVEKAFSKAYAVEATLNTQSRAAKALKQAVLKTAFEGKLVPQDPKDEPASELLKRIKAAS